MTHSLRKASLAFAIAGGCLFAFATIGMSAAALDRPASIAVVGDDDALVTVEQVNTTVTSGQSEAVLRYHNRLAGDLESVNVSVHKLRGSNVSLDEYDPPEQLPQGEAESVAVTLSCEQQTSAELVFMMQAQGNDTSVSITRTHTVTCTPA